ncbi:hypothetical protein QNN00_15830 [Bacillus velezensis]|nr:hypothetical protein [Bacillus velezensis]
MAEGMISGMVRAKKFPTKTSA